MRLGEWWRVGGVQEKVKEGIVEGRRRKRSRKDRSRIQMRKGGGEREKTSLIFIRTALGFNYCNSYLCSKSVRLDTQG